MGWSVTDTGLLSRRIPVPTVVRTFTKCLSNGLLLTDWQTNSVSVATWTRRRLWEVWSFLRPCQCTVVHGSHSVVCACVRSVFSSLFKYLQSHPTFEKKYLKIGNMVVLIMGRKTQQKTSEDLEGGGIIHFSANLLVTVSSGTKDMLIPRAEGACSMLDRC